MGSQLPYRLPCEAVPGAPKYFLGGPFQHGSKPVLVDKFVNTTTVPDPCGSPGVFPYERFTQDFSAPGSCEVHQCGANCNAPCSAWPIPYPPNTFQKNGQVNFAVSRKRGFKCVIGKKNWQGVLGYTEKELNEGVDTVTGCNPTRLAFRTAQAAPKRTRYRTITVQVEYSDTEWDYSGGGAGVPSTVTDQFEFTQTIDSESGLLTFDLTQPPAGGSGEDSGDTAGGSVEGGCVLNAYLAFWNWNQIVNRFTMLTRGGTPNYNGNSATASDPSSGNVFEQLNWDLGGGSFSRTTWDYFPQQLVDLQESASVSETSFEYSSTENSYVTAAGSAAIGSSIQVTVTATLSDPYQDSDVYNEVCGSGGLLSLWNLADDDQYPWRTDVRCGIGPLVCRDEKLSQNWNQETYWARDFGQPIANSSLPNATMPSPFWAGNCGIIANPDPDTGTAVVVIPLKVNEGDVFLPTPIDNPFPGSIATFNVSGQWPPGVNFDAGTGTYSGTVSGTPGGNGGYYGVTITITGPARYTGNILGAPLPAGYQNYFDFGYEDWKGCCFDNDGDLSWDWYQYGWGMSLETYNALSRSQLPETSTKWPNWFQSANKPQGAWLFYNDRGSYFAPNCIDSNNNPSGALDGNALWACKYAEILDIWPSQNFARPGGNDKFSYDETQVYCAQNISGAGAGSKWQITDSFGNTPADSTDFSGIWGGPVVAGFYNVSNYSGGVLTLGAKAYNIPSNWASLSGDTATCFGKLRFPNAPSLLGRAAISSQPSAPTTLNFASPQPSFGMSATTVPAAQEIVDLWDNNMNLIAGGVTATRKDDYSFKTPVAYPTTAYVTITGAPKWYMSDADPKGDYAYLTWMSDFRTAGISNGIDTPSGEFVRTTGITDCNGNQISQPAANAGGGPVQNPYAAFSQTPGCIPFVPCGPKIVCISPNGEQFPNGVTYPFPHMLAGGSNPSQDPGAFYFDQYYGTKWWGSIHATMTDLLWQAPHRPCNLDVSIGWKMDQAQCSEDDDTTHWFAYYPQVECRLTVPCNFGQNQDECAPTLPAGIQIGWLSPVNYSAGDVALPPIPGFDSSGAPGGAGSAFELHVTLCHWLQTGCRFNYSAPAC